MSSTPPLLDEGPPLRSAPAGPEPEEVPGSVWIREAAPEPAGWLWVLYKKRSAEEPEPVSDVGTPEKIDTKDWKTLVVSWLLSQGVSTVFLAAILGTMAYMGHYAMTIAIPAHLHQIQDGYEKQTALHKEALLQQQQAFERSLSHITDLHEREWQFRDRRTSSKE